MRMIGDGKGGINGIDGKRKVYVYVRSIRNDGCNIICHVIPAS